MFSVNIELGMSLFHHHDQRNDRRNVTYVDMEKRKAALRNEQQKMDEIRNQFHERKDSQELTNFVSTFIGDSGPATHFKPKADPHTHKTNQSFCESKRNSRQTRTRHFTPIWLLKNQ